MGHTPYTLTNTRPPSVLIALSHLNSIMNSSWHLMLHVLSNGYLLGIAYFIGTVVIELVNNWSREKRLTCQWKVPK